MIWSLKATRRCVCCASLGLAQAVLAQGLPEINQKIIEEGEKHNQAYLHIRHLTKKIGPRLLGSDKFTNACNWTLKKFKDWGLKNVHFEPYMEVPIAFNRGKRQIGRMVTPATRDFQFTTSAWSAGTKGSIKGFAIEEPKDEEEFSKVKDSLKGAWVLAGGEGLGIRTRPDEAKVEFRKKVEDAGIAGWIYASANEYVTTNGNFRNLVLDALPTIPRITVRASDMSAIREALKSGKKPELEFDIDNRFGKKKVTVNNVVADIPGTEKPDEFVIIGAHLDSWDGPGSEGACDNATGSTAILEAARILGKCNVKPKRTIRFILFSGEEEGLLGSTAYVKDHEKEIDKISAVFVDDSGTNYDSGVMCSETASKWLFDASEPLKKTDPKFEFKVTTFQPSPDSGRRRGGGGGSDHAPFAAQGIPAYFMRKTGNANYMEIWHTQNDNLEHVIVDNVKRSSLVFAILSYNLACANELVPRN